MCSRRSALTVRRAVNAVRAAVTVTIAEIAVSDLIAAKVVASVPRVKVVALQQMLLPLQRLSRQRRSTRR